MDKLDRSIYTALVGYPELSEVDERDVAEIAARLRTCLAVEITEHMVGSYARGWEAMDTSLDGDRMGKGLRRRAGLRAALEAAGFIVAPDRP